MVRSCPLAELFSELAQSGCSKAGQSRATKRGVGLGGNFCCGYMKQQNDPFVLRFAAWHQPRAASSIGFPQAIRLPRFPIVSCTDAVQSTRDVLDKSNASQRAI